ncbi:MAG: serine/threonine-protein phosphatase [Fimbriimonadaceae bacterium]|nr:serine/threonine-protein phosphatase [Fimbriimonadaceae bacterium]
MSSTLPVLPEGTVLAGTLEVWRHLGATADGQLYAVLDNSGQRPVRRLLLARAAGDPPDLRQPGQPGRGALPGVLLHLPYEDQDLLLLDAVSEGWLVSQAPVRDDETALELLRAAAEVADEVVASGGTLTGLTAENLGLRPDGGLVYLGPLRPAGPAEVPDVALGLLADELLDPAGCWSVELSQLLGELHTGQCALPQRLAALRAAHWSGDIAAAVGLASDGGPYRAHNDDTALHLVQTMLTQGEPEAYDLLAVADGVGGHRDGDRAARLGLSALVSGLTMALAEADLAGEPLPAQGNGALFEALRAAVLAADEAVRGLRDDLPKGPGTTLVAGLRLGRRLFLANVGDSRAYLWRDQQLQRLTRDDSLVQALLDEGQLTDDEAALHPDAGVLTQCLGQGEPVQPTLVMRLLRPGDRLLLCSDGLTERLRDRDLASLLEQQPEAWLCAEALTVAARWAGAKDNITVLVVNLTGEADG